MLKQNSESMQATADAYPLISDTFILNGLLTDLHLYPGELRLLQKDFERVIPLRFGLTFRVLYRTDGKAIGLEFNNAGECLILIRDFWHRGAEWEDILLKHMIRQDFHEFFKPLKKLGCGNFATVYLAQDLRHNRRVAIKAFMKEVACKGDGKAAIQNEIKLMRKIRNENIMELYGVYETKNSMYLAMEYVEGMTLEHFLRKNGGLSVEQRKKLLRGLLNGVKCLQENRILHRDLKPENIMVSASLDKVKIVDFGLATHIDEPNYIFVRCGTPGFVAPEILKIRDVTSARLGLQADVFSLGAIYYQVLYGRPLFEGKDQQDVLTKNRLCQFRCPQNKNTWVGQADLLKSMLAPDQSFRVTAEAALESYFLRERKDIKCRALKTIDNTTMEDETQPVCGFWANS